MPFKTFDTLDAVPTDQRDKAIERKDGKFIVEEPVDVAALKEEGKRALDKERERADTEEKERKRIAKELDDLKRANAARDSGVSEDALKKIKEDEEKARKPILDELEQTKAENRKLKLNDGAKSLWLRYGGYEAREEDAMDALLKRADLSDKGNIVLQRKDGTKIVVEKPEDAAPFFEEFKKEKGWYFRGSDSSGSGSDASSDGAGGSSYDPVAAGKKAAEQQKRGAGENALAFK